METLRQIAEDAFLLGAEILEGEDLEESREDQDNPTALSAQREFRIAELVINLGERLCAVAGVDDPWIPKALRGLVETG